jgi:hypothetical protein
VLASLPPHLALEWRRWHDRLQRRAAPCSAEPWPCTRLARRFDEKSGTVLSLQGNMDELQQVRACRLPLPLPLLPLPLKAAPRLDPARPLVATLPPSCVARTHSSAGVGPRLP